MKHNLSTFKFQAVGGLNPKKQKYRKGEVDQKIEDAKQELQKMLMDFKKGGSLPYSSSDMIKQLLGEDKP